MIVLDSKDLSTIDEKYAADSKVWQPLSAGAKNITSADFAGVNFVYINKMSGIAQATQYNRNGDNARQKISMSKEPVKLTHEDWMGYDLDQFDMSENSALEVARVVEDHRRFITIPNRDRVAVQTLYDSSEDSNSSDNFVTGTIDKSNVLEAYDTAEQYLTDNEIPGGYILFASSSFYMALKNAEKINRNFDVNTTSINGINRTISRLDNGVPIMEVPKDRLTGTNAANKKINFIIAPLISIAPIVKYNNVSVINPDTDRSGYRWTIKGLDYYDAVVFENAKDSIYTSVTDETVQLSDNAKNQPVGKDIETDRAKNTVNGKSKASNVSGNTQNKDTKKN